MGLEFFQHYRWRVGGPVVVAAIYIDCSENTLIRSNTCFSNWVIIFSQVGSAGQIKFP